MKQYGNLHRIYCRSVRKLKIPFWVCLMVFFLAFGTFVIDNFPFEASLAMMGMIFPALLFGILWLIAGVRTRIHFKAFSPQQLSRIDAEAPFCEMCDGLLVTGEAVVGNKIGLQLVPMAKVLWVYTTVRTSRLEGLIPIYKDTLLVVACRDHKRYGFRIKNNQKAFLFMQEELLKHRQDIVLGYERGMDDIYRHDINRLIAFGQECAEKRRKEMESA